MQWFRQLFTRRSIYRDLSEEIRQHLAEKIEALMAGGMSRQEAEYAAKREFGNVTRTEESGREAWLDLALAGVLEQRDDFASQVPIYGCAITRSAFGASGCPRCSEHH